MRMLLPLVLLVVTLSGCAFTTANVALKYETSPERKSPLSTIPPRTVALKVDDQRPAGERNRVGDKKNGFGAVTASVQSTKDVSAVVRDALKAELENNGHTVTDGTTRADATLVAALKRCWSDISIKFWEVVLVGTVAADVAVDGGAGGRGSSPLPVTATYEEGFQVVTDSRFETVLNRALAEFVRNFSRDPAVLEALKK